MLQQLLLDIFNHGREAPSTRREQRGVVSEHCMRSEHTLRAAYNGPEVPPLPALLESSKNAPRDVVE